MESIIEFIKSPNVFRVLAEFIIVFASDMLMMKLAEKLTLFERSRKTKMITELICTIIAVIICIAFSIILTIVFFEAEKKAMITETAIFCFLAVGLYMMIMSKKFIIILKSIRNKK